jgi:peptide deformylase
MKNTLLNNDTFYKESSLGIAANQLGENYRIMYISKYPAKEDLRYKHFEYLFNPKIELVSDVKSIYWEGCLSDKE